MDGKLRLWTEEELVGLIRKTVADDQNAENEQLIERLSELAKHDKRTV